MEALQLDAGEVTLRVVSEGAGPLVVFCHGYPGLWYSWRHQLPALAQAGYRAVALDMRGYGRSSRPLTSDAYGLDRLSNDVLAVLDYFGEEHAVVVGHDFGANLAWHMARAHTDRVRAVAPLCVPYEMELAGGGDTLPSELYAAIAAQHFFHMHYYQAVGVAEAHCLGREEEMLRKLFWALSGEGELLNWENFPSEGTTYLDVLAEPARPLPWSWLSQQDLDYYVSEYLAAGPDLTFIGGANSYRAMDYNWRLTRKDAHADIEIPVLFVGGMEDPTIKLAGDGPLQHMREKARDLRAVELLPGAGHFVQQERPEAVNKLLLNFLSTL
ncbi:MAG: alpha/beta hydrolase [Halieaceae bacterium]